jgi:hypothetical protein
MLAEGENNITWTATDEAGYPYSCITNVTFEFNVGIPDFKQRNVSVNPNPSKGILIIGIPASCNEAIYDMKGKIIRSAELIMD